MPLDDAHPSPSSPANSVPTLRDDAPRSPGEAANELTPLAANTANGPVDAGGGPGDAGGGPGEVSATGVRRLRPRAWTSFLVVAVSGGTFLVSSALMTVIAIIVVHGAISIQLLRDPQMLVSVMGSRLGLFIMVVLPQLALVVPCIVAAILSPVATTRRLGLVRGWWPLWIWIAAALATPLVGMVSGVLVQSLMEESESLKELSKVFRSHGQSGFMIPLALMIGITPAFCEELLFRGYMQTRLTQSFPPLFGLLVSSILFAAFHLDPVHSIAVFPLGLYLGWLTWQSGSLIPAILGHFVNNSLSVVLAALAIDENPSALAAPGLAFMAGILALGATGLAAVCYASVMYRPPDRPRAIGGPPTPLG